MKIHLGTDHAGFIHKETLKEFLMQKGYEVIDHGAHELDPDDNYPDFIAPVASAIAKNPDDRGIVFGGSGQGEAMVANRVVGVRAAVYYGGDKDIITLSRTHNDANILSIGARFVSAEEANSLAILWLETAFSREERHRNRINMF